MKVMVIVKATSNSEAGKLPSTDLLKAMGEAVAWVKRCPNSRSMIKS